MQYQVYGDSDILRLGEIIRSVNIWENNIAPIINSYCNFDLLMDDDEKMIATF